jgi:hypothetical protein
VKFCNSGGNSVYTNELFTGLPIERFILGAIFDDTFGDTLFIGLLGICSCIFWKNGAGWCATGTTGCFI